MLLARLAFQHCVLGFGAGRVSASVVRSRRGLFVWCVVSGRGLCRFDRGAFCGVLFWYRWDLICRSMQSINQSIDQSINHSVGLVWAKFLTHSFDLTYRTISTYFIYEFYFIWTELCDDSTQIALCVLVDRCNPLRTTPLFSVLQWGFLRLPRVVHSAVRCRFSSAPLLFA